MKAKQSSPSKRKSGRPAKAKPKQSSPSKRKSGRPAKAKPKRMRRAAGLDPPVRARAK